MLKSLSFILFFINSIAGYAQSESLNLHDFEGLYEDDSGGRYILNPGDDFPHLLNIKDGETHMLRELNSNKYEISITRNNWDETGGEIELINDGERKSICITTIDTINFPN